MKPIYRGTTSDRHASQASNSPFQQVRESEAAYNLRVLVVKSTEVGISAL